MFGGMFVSGALIGMLRDYLDAREIAAPECRARLDEWPLDARIPLGDWILLLEQIRAVDPRPALGLYIGQCIAPRHAGVMGYLAGSCHSLGEAFLRFDRFHRLVYDGNPAQMAVHGDVVTASWGIEHGLPGQLADETAIAAFATIVRKLVNRRLAPTAVNFVNAAPADIGPYEEFFGCPVTFGGTLTCVTFPASHLLLPIAHSDPGLRALLENQAESLLRALPSQQSFQTELKEALVRSLHEGMPTLECVAQRLAMSPRTLQRRLAELDLNFQHLLDRTRAELARGYILEGNLTLSEIALLLGYSEQSAFNRAFKRWTGQTPKSLRRK
ncbi:MAG: AraC family transcriptional regulator [Moraxellaceae bacterium]|jgi:AraC-like DNA-binding protein|nr:AraC family transcriptional regulator [Moraxellaceae bacterium]